MPVVCTPTSTASIISIVVVVVGVFVSASPASAAAAAVVFADVVVVVMETRLAAVVGKGARSSAVLTASATAIDSHAAKKSFTYCTFEK